MDKDSLKTKLLIEIMSCGTTDIKALDQIIDTCLYDYSIIKHKEVLPTSGDGTATKCLFELFVKDKYASGCATSSMKAYFLAVQKLFSFVKKEVVLVTKDDLTAYFAFYRNGGENFQHNFSPVTDNTLASRYAHLSSFYTWLFTNHYIAENPFATIKPPRRKVPHKDVIVAQDLEKMIIACEEYYKKPLKLARNTAIVLLLIESGVRNNELCNIKVKDIDFKLNRIIIRNGKGNKERKVYFGDRSKERILKYLSLCDKNPDGYLFTHYSSDSKLSTAGIETVIKQVGKISKLPKLYPHLFRASFATKLIDSGVSPMIVRDLLGHTNLDTLECYVHLTDNMVHDAIRVAIDC